MDFLSSDHITKTQVIGDDAGDMPYELPPPLNPKHTALQSDFEIITMTVM